MTEYLFSFVKTVESASAWQPFSQKVSLGTIYYRSQSYGNEAPALHYDKKSVGPTCIMANKRVPGLSEL